MTQYARSLDGSLGLSLGALSRKSLSRLSLAGNFNISGRLKLQGKIRFPDSFVPTSLTFQDGYFIVRKAETGRFYISDLLNPASWYALDYATAEGLHDNLVAVHSNNRDLWLLGSESMEIWYNSGESAFPFARYSGGFINIGCKAAGSVVSSEQGVFW